MHDTTIDGGFGRWAFLEVGESLETQALVRALVRGKAERRRGEAA